MTPENGASNRLPSRKKIDFFLATSRGAMKSHVFTTDYRKYPLEMLHIKTPLSRKKTNFFPPPHREWFSRR